MKLSVKIALLLLVIILPVKALPEVSVLEKYISDGKQNSRRLKQKLALVNKSRKDLIEAKGIFFPDVDVTAKYSVARGGRTIDMPFSNYFNESTQHNGHYNIPDIIENQRIPFERPREQETKIVMSRPFFDLSVFYNYLIKKDLIKVAEMNVDLFENKLVVEIKQAYFSYLKCSKLDSLYFAENKQLKENWQMAKALAEDFNDSNEIYRLEADYIKAKLQKDKTLQDKNLAAAYFNFLIGHPFHSPIIEDEQFSSVINSKSYLLGKEYKVNTVEMKLYSEYMKIQDKHTRLLKSFFIPSITGTVNLGYIGENYSFNDDNNFFYAGFQLKWNIFNGFQNKSKIQKSKIEKQMLKWEFDELQEGLNLAALNLSHELNSIVDAVPWMEKRIISTSNFYESIRNQLQTGQLNISALLEGYDDLIDAKKDLITANYEYQIKHTEFELILNNPDPN